MNEAMRIDLEQEIRRVELLIKAVGKAASESKDNITRVIRNGELNTLKAQISTMEMVIRKYC